MLDFTYMTSGPIRVPLVLSAAALALAALLALVAPAAAAPPVDKKAPTTVDNVPTTWQKTDVTVTLTATDIGGSGVDKTYYTLGTKPAKPTTASPIYNAASKPVLTNGQRIRYFSVDRAGNAEPARNSAVAQVDKLPPGTSDNVPAGWQKADVTVTLTASDTGGSGVSKTYYTTGISPANPTVASPVYDSANKPILANGQRIRYFSVDLAGNAEAVKTSAAAQVDKLPPTTTDDVPTSWQKDDVTVTLTASDPGGSGVAKTYYTTGTNPPDPTTASAVYNPAKKPVLTNGQRIKYFSVDLLGNAEAVRVSATAQVDKGPLTTTDDVPASWQKDDVTVTLTATTTGGSGIGNTYYTIGVDPANPNTASATYNPANKPVLTNGQRIKYFASTASVIPSRSRRAPRRGSTSSRRRPAKTCRRAGGRATSR